ncbi:endoglucanase [Sorangium cellulosum]|uniref:endo-1,4-beta-xylanase n=2 Tax=Sorangium cellulosum TaxID=56 RepID=A0A150QZX4_SORCE|nr:endoglucanase [Sorangium cellulosum]
MKKNRSSRWLCGAAWMAVAISALSGCSGRTDAAGAGPGGSSSAAGSTGAGGHGGSAGTTGTGGAGTGSAGTGGSGDGGAGDGGAGGSGTSSSGAGGSGGGTGGSGGASTRKFVGNITTNNVVRDDFIRYWDQITPEVVGRWTSIETSRGVRDWSRLDPVYDYARAHGIPFMQHAFVWGTPMPAWFGRLSEDEMRQAVRDWMQAFCERYPDTEYIVVVNEPPPHTTPTFKNAIGGDGASGHDWIVNSFKWARELCPGSTLILNDYSNIEYEVEHARFVELVKTLLDAGAPIDALGAQAHDAYKINTSTVKGYIDGLAATGLPVYITEYDIDLADDGRQRQVMEEQLTMFHDHSAVKGITLYGYVVGSTWRSNTGLLHPDGTQRPAMAWLMDFLGRGE